MRGSSSFILLCISLFLGSLLLTASRRTEFMKGLEYKTLDWRFRHFSDASRRDPRIVFAFLDQQSLDQFERDSLTWPWPRSIYNAVLKFCKRGGARLVVFDVLFTGPSSYGPADDADFGKGLK